jgi:hypothetical protein
MELTRLDFITATSAPEQRQLKKRFEIFRSSIVKQPTTPEKELAPLMFANFRVHDFKANQIIWAQGARLDVLQGHEGDLRTLVPENAQNASADGGPGVKDLYLDFITKGTVQLIRKTEFIQKDSCVAIEAAAVPLYKNLPLLELSEGDCYSALDIYGCDYQNISTCAKEGMPEERQGREQMKEESKSKIKCRSVSKSKSKSKSKREDERKRESVCTSTLESPNFKTSIAFGHKNAHTSHQFDV